MRPARGEPFHERQQQRRIAQVGLDGLRHPGILDLDGHLVAVERGGAVHLADRGGGERLLVEVAEHAPERAAELLAHQLLEIREPHRRDVVAKRGEAALQLVPLVFGRPSNSTIEIIWPTFIAAPRICPSWSTSCWTSAAVRSLSADAARSGVRTRLAVRIPAHRRP